MTCCGYGEWRPDCGTCGYGEVFKAIQTLYSKESSQKGG